VAAPRGRLSLLLIALSVGLAAGIGYPFVSVGLACRVPVSEACVWGRAYFPLTLAVSVVIVGGGVTGLLYAVLSWRRGKAPGTRQP
jgi:hypothetical protein